VCGQQPSSVEIHVNAIFTELGLTTGHQSHRRVTAVLTFLRDAGLRTRGIPEPGRGRPHPNLRRTSFCSAAGLPSVEVMAASTQKRAAASEVTGVRRRAMGALFILSGVLFLAGVLDPPILPTWGGSATGVMATASAHRTA
jgi:hypothetical protein